MIETKKYEDMITKEEIKVLIEVQRIQRITVCKLKSCTTLKEDTLRYETVIRFIDGFISDLQQILNKTT